MKLNIEDLSLIYPEQLLVDFSLENREKAWQHIQSQGYVKIAASWNAYINYLCLQIFLDYIKNEPELNLQPKVLSQEDDLLTFWQIVNGTAIEVNKTRLVLIPSDNSDLTELRVPQEWVDIPALAGNYYLAVELNLEECWLRVCGYATYQQLKDEGTYDPIDRTYALDLEDLIEDLTVMWTVIELYPSKKPAVKALPILSASEAEFLLQKLNHSNPYSPRLDLPFSQWGALIADERWRKKLDRMQQKQVNIVNLGQWLQNVFADGWQSLDEIINTQSANLAFSFRQGKSADRQIAVEGIKLIDLGMQLGEISLALLIGLIPENDSKISIRVQLYPTGGNSYLPANLKLTLLSRSNKILQEIESRDRDNLIQLKRFSCLRGTQFSIQVSLADFSITENFLIEANE